MDDSEFDAIAYLSSKSLRPTFVSGGTEAVYPCFMDCGEPPDSRKRKWYINVATGLYGCKVCGCCGGSTLLTRWFGDEPRKSGSDELFLRQRILDQATAVGSEMLLNNDAVLDWLMEERGLEPDTIETKKLGFVGSGWSLVGSLPSDFTAAQLAITGLVWKDGSRKGQDYFWNHLLIPVLSKQHVRTIRGRLQSGKGAKYLSGAGEVTRVYNSDTLEDAEEVILCEGELDCIITEQELAKSHDLRVRKIAVIAIPGVDAVPSELGSLLSAAKHVYMAFDSDQPGKDAAEKFVEKLGKRVKILRLPDEYGKCDMSMWLLPARSGDTTWTVEHPYAGHDWRDIMRLISGVRGKRVFTIAEAAEAYRQQQLRGGGIKTGYKGFDAAVHPGLLEGQVTVILASTGTGKSVLTCNLVYNMRAVPQLILSLEMTKAEYYHRLYRIYTFYHPNATQAEIEFAYQGVTINDDNRLAPGEVEALVEESEAESGFRPKLVHVDYLGYYCRGQPGATEYAQASNGVMELKGIAKAGGFHIITPSQVSRGSKPGKPLDLDGARGSGVIEETADFALGLYRPDDALREGSFTTQSAPSGRLKLELLKSRHGGVGATFPLQMDLLHLAIVDESSSHARLAKQHNQSNARGTTWEDLREIETAPHQESLRLGVK